MLSSINELHFREQATSVLAGFYGPLNPRLRVDLLSLSLSNRSRKKTAIEEKKIGRARYWRRDACFSRGHVFFYLAVFFVFRVSLHGLSRRRTTRSLPKSRWSCNLEMLVFKREDNCNTRRENLGAGREPRRNSTYLWYCPGIEHGPHWRKASALTTVLHRSLSNFRKVSFGFLYSSQDAPLILSSLKYLRSRVIMIFWYFRKIPTLRKLSSAFIFSLNDLWWCSGIFGRLRIIPNKQRFPCLLAVVAGKLGREQKL